MYKKAGFWAALFSAVIGISALLLVLGRTKQSNVALIYQGEVLLYRIDLELVALPYELTIECESGTNDVLVEHGRISVRSATCPDKVCVHHAPLPGSMTPIVCLPHKLFISMEER